MAIQIPCDKCHGRGKVDLPEQLQETYDAVARGIQTAPEIHAVVSDNENFGVTAINRRLEQLINLGFVVRTKKRRGKAFLYEAKLQPRKQNGRGSSKT